MQVKSFYLSLDKASDMFDPKKIKFATIPWEELEKEFPAFSKLRLFARRKHIFGKKKLANYLPKVLKKRF